MIISLSLTFHTKIEFYICFIPYKSPLAITYHNILCLDSKASLDSQSILEFWSSVVKLNSSLWFPEFVVKRES